MQSTRKHKRGFTLVETVVVVGVFVLIMGAIMSAILYFYRTNAHTVEQIYAVESARKGIELMVRDLRETAYADHGGYPLVSIDDTEILFYSDVDRDDSVERIRYRIVNGVLEKGVTNATGVPAVYNDADEVFSVVSTDVRNIPEGIDLFSYFDEAGVEVTNFGNVTDVVFVTIELIININPARLPENFTLRSSAALRNLKTNL